MYSNNTVLIKAIRWWLTGLLFFIPFVTRISNIIEPWNRELARLIDRIDELTVVILLPFALRAFYYDYKKKEKSQLLCLIILLPIMILCISGLLSGIVNGNNLLITARGAFSYVEYFLFVFIFAAFFSDSNAFLKVFRYLTIVAVIIGFVAFVQEISAIITTYVLENDISDSNNGFIRGLRSVLLPQTVQGAGWRLGIFRASSLLSHYNLLGLYSLLILTVYLYINKRVNIIVIFSLLSGVLASVSRTVYAGFELLAGLQIFRGRKWFALFFIPVAAALFYMGVLGENIDMPESAVEQYQAANTTEFPQKITYREFARHKAMIVWGDYPLLGVGPGMFGGSVAYKYHSPIYEEYNFNTIMIWFHSLDQLWPQVLAEMGIVGTAALSAIFLSMLLMLIMTRRHACSDEIRGLFDGLFVFTFIFLIYTFSGNLNIVSVLLPYCAFAGMGLGSLRSGAN